MTNRNKLTPSEDSSKTRHGRVASLLGRLRGRSGVERQPETLAPPEPIYLDTSLQELATEGFDRVAYGRGPWVIVDRNENRIIDEWGVKHPDGRVVALSVYKFYSIGGGHTVRSDLQRSDFADDGTYAEHVAEWQLKMTADEPLTDMLAKMQATEQP